jgi:hypothetical protein
MKVGTPVALRTRSRLKRKVPLPHSSGFVPRSSTTTTTTAESLRDSSSFDPRVELPSSCSSTPSPHPSDADGDPLIKSPRTRTGKDAKSARSLHLEVEMSDRMSGLSTTQQQNQQNNKNNNNQTPENQSSASSSPSDGGSSQSSSEHQQQQYMEVDSNSSNNNDAVQVAGNCSKDMDMSGNSASAAALTTTGNAFAQLGSGQRTVCGSGAAAAAAMGGGKSGRRRASPFSSAAAVASRANVGTTGTFLRKSASAATPPSTPGLTTSASMGAIGRDGGGGAQFVTSSSKINNENENKRTSSNNNIDQKDDGAGASDAKSGSEEEETTGATATSTENEETKVVVVEEGVPSEHGEEGQLLAVTVLATSELEPFTNPAEELTNTLAGAVSDDWLPQFRAAESTRRLCVFHSELLTIDSLSVLLPFLEREAGSLRSAQARNALLAFQDFFRAGIPTTVGSIEHMNGIVCALVLKAVNEKRFIATAAAGALDELVKAHPKPIVLSALLTYHVSKSPRVCAQASLSAIRCAQNMSKESLAECTRSHDGQALVSTASLENGRSVEARKPAQALLRRMKDALGEIEFTKLCTNALEQMDCARVMKIVMAPKKKKATQRGKSIRELMIEKNRKKAANEIANEEDGEASSN